MVLSLARSLLRRAGATMAGTSGFNGSASTIPSCYLIFIVTLFLGCQEISVRIILVDAEVGLRERKKQRTRVLIAETARHLFIERGFEAVSVAEIAREAEVSEATVFNYFPTKEDLVYHGMEAFEAELLAAIGDRPPGQSVIDAFGRFISQPRGFLAATDPASRETLIRASHMIAASPALMAREHQILAGYTQAVALLLAEETGAHESDVGPWVAANALVGIHGALIGFVRRRLLGGVRPPGHAWRRTSAATPTRPTTCSARGWATTPYATTEQPGADQLGTQTVGQRSLE